MNFAPLAQFTLASETLLPSWAVNKPRALVLTVCNSCHTLLAQGSGPQLGALHAQGLEFKHPGGDLDPELSCVDCHNGGVQK